MSKCKLISPLLDDFIVGDAISHHNGVRCYPAMKNGEDSRYILKVISIPASSVQLDALLVSGAYQSREQVTAYFAQVTKDVENEVDILDRLAKMEGFVTYEGFQIVENETSSGYDIYLLGTYKHNLERHFRKYPMTHLSAVNLGLDVCAALAVCRQAGFLYADLKPGNIFITEDNRYRIGDLGFLPIIGLKYASLPDRYRSSYTAPELADPLAPITPGIDIYAIGLILYQAFNGGVLPFNGAAPQEPLPSPLYADYEMSEIILKACAPDPADRWEDPIKMGQALVGYMQRNSVNDTPIVPPIVPIDEVISEQPDEDLVEEQTATEDDENLSFLDSLNTDETVPQEESASQVGYGELTDDVCNMMEQADDLLAHEPPAPPVAPEPVEIKMPEPIAAKEEASNTVDDTIAAITEALSTEEVPVRDDAPIDEIAAAPFEAPAEDTEQDELEDAFDVYVDRKPKKNIVNKVLAALLALIIVGCIAVAGFLFYRDYYIKTIDTLQLEGADDQLTVYVSTKADHSLLRVVCTDTYGNKLIAPLEGGYSTFSDLTPDMMYTITVEVEGFHGVNGNCRTSYTTAPRTEVVSFNAITGAESGTCILNFSIKGQDYDQWKLTYSTDGEPEQNVAFSGHMVTIAGLTIDKTYTFTLDTAGNGYVVGQNKVEYHATPLVYPEALNVTAFDENGLTVVWNDPADTDVTSWTVLCYNDLGYSQNVTTAENTAQFTGINPADSYTVEVTAAGMSVGERFYISKNAVVITNLTATPSMGGLDISWTHSGEAPASEWIVTYTIDDGTTETSVPTSGTTGRIDAVVPGAVYNIKVQLKDGTTVINSIHKTELSPAEAFAGYGVSANSMVWSMCLAPAGDDWIWWNVQSFQNSFAAGQRAGFVVRLTNLYGRSDDMINVVYAVRDKDGKIVSVHNVSQSWTSMWWDLNWGWQNQGEFNVPALPAAAGDYTMEIYFNGASVHQQSFTITQ